MEPSEDCMKPIEELTKSELLSLIYNNMRSTLFIVHPCECCACGTEKGDVVEIEGRHVEPIFYICDRCEEN